MHLSVGPAHNSQPKRLLQQVATAASGYLLEESWTSAARCGVHPQRAHIERTIRCSRYAGNFHPVDSIVLAFPSVPFSLGGGGGSWGKLN